MWEYRAKIGQRAQDDEGGYQGLEGGCAPDVDAPEKGHHDAHGYRCANGAVESWMNMGEVSRKWSCVIAGETPPHAPTCDKSADERGECGKEEDGYKAHGACVGAGCLSVDLGGWKEADVAGVDGV